MRDALKIAIIGKDPAIPLLLQALLRWDQRTAISVVDEAYRPAVSDYAFSQYYHSRAIIQGTTYATCKETEIAIFFQEEMNDLDLSGNLELLQSKVKKMMQSGFYGKVIVATKYSNEAASEIKRLSGLPAQNIIAIGTLLLTRFVQFQLATKFQVSSENVHSYVIGDSEAHTLPLWSRSYIGVKPLLTYIAEQNELFSPGDLQQLEQNLADVTALDQLSFGMESALVFGITEILEAIAFDQSKVLTVGIEVNTKYAVPEPLFLSLPAVIAKEGVKNVLEIKLSEQEQKNLDQIVAAHLANPIWSGKEGEGTHGI